MSQSHQNQQDEPTPRLDRFFQERLGQLESQPPAQSDPWARMNALLDSTEKGSAFSLGIGTSQEEATKVVTLEGSKSFTSWAKWVAVAASLLCVVGVGYLVSQEVQAPELAYSTAAPETAASYSSIDSSLTNSSIALSNQNDAASHENVVEQRSTPVLDYGVPTALGGAVKQKAVVKASAEPAEITPAQTSNQAIASADMEAFGASVEKERPEWDRSLPENVRASNDYIPELDTILPPVRVKIQYAASGWKSAKDQSASSLANKKPLLAEKWSKFKKVASKIWNIKNGEEQSPTNSSELLNVLEANTDLGQLETETSQ